MSSCRCIFIVIFICFCLKIFFVLTYSVDPDEISHYAAFPFGLNYLYTWPFGGLP